MTQQTTPQPSYKHHEWILVADASWINQQFPEGLTQLPLSFFEDALPYTSVRQRKAVEENLNYRQYLPYQVLWRMNAEGKREYFVYQRTRKIGENKLFDKFSLGMGGHIDSFEIDGPIHPGSLAEFVFLNANREFVEEIEIDIETGHPVNSSPYFAPFMEDSAIVSEKPNKWRVLVDNSDKVGQFHFAIVIFHEIKEGVNIACAEEELRTVGFMTKEAILQQGLDLENWSKIVLDQEQ